MARGYLRNALVRANYRNLAKGISYEPLFLIRFFRNLLLGESPVLKNRHMIINPPEEWKMLESEQLHFTPPRLKCIVLFGDFWGHPHEHLSLFINAFRHHRNSHLNIFQTDTSSNYLIRIGYLT